MKKLNCIMLIDDNEDDNFFHSIVIKEANATEEILVAESGIEALEILKTAKVIPELIFLDINMPKMNGWEFLVEYEKLPEDKKAKTIVVMLTTSLNPYDKTKADGIILITGFETKPLTDATLKKILEDHFSK